MAPYYSSRVNDARTFAARIASMGFEVYLAKSQEYGFITDETHKRVLSFSFNMPDRLGGNYWPHSSESGTGWMMEAGPENLKTAEDVKRYLYMPAPGFAGKGWKTYTTVEQHLKVYGSSSQYKRVSHTVSVTGAYGTLTVDASTGEVFDYLTEGFTRAPGEYADILCFDWQEWREAYSGKEPCDCDILDVGFWTTKGDYCAAEDDFRGLITEARETGLID